MPDDLQQATSWSFSIPYSLFFVTLSSQVNLSKYLYHQQKDKKLEV